MSLIIQWLLKVTLAANQNCQSNAGVRKWGKFSSPVLTFLGYIFEASCTIFGQVDYQKVSLDQSKFRISFTQFVAFTFWQMA